MPTKAGQGHPSGGVVRDWAWAPLFTEPLLPAVPPWTKCRWEAKKTSATGMVMSKVAASDFVMVVGGLKEVQQRDVRA
ncbi:hypothetical protein [Streptomyces sp. NBC_00986]|uniref:hypothetical protein n=1 Tax=Streptomyces sp. NBC_00986 TaxID=2903702 RepID=UPI00386A56F8|nr:hypothetical protein OG504_35820 [Streptomyces sp. NBC_00986]